jgi:hypothetical protein
MTKGLFTKATQEIEFPFTVGKVYEIQYHPRTYQYHDSLLAHTNEGWQRYEGDSTNDFRYEVLDLLKLFKVAE